MDPIATQNNLNRLLKDGGDSPDWMKVFECVASLNTWVTNGGFTEGLKKIEHKEYIPFSVQEFIRMYNSKLP